MKDKLTTFQLVLFGFTIFLIVAGVLFFALKRTSQNDIVIPIEMWGTLPAVTVNAYQELINNNSGSKTKTVDIIYKEFPESRFENELINSLAAGRGPDVVIFNDDFLAKHEDKLFNIPYESYPQVDYKNNFIQASEILLKSNGITGFPFLIDPIVMYWNRTILNSSGISKPPAYWDELVEMSPQLTKSDSSANITKSAVALGEFRNIKNAKAIFNTLVAQAGNPVIVRNQQNNFTSIFNERLGYGIAPADATFNFYTQFSNPTRRTYSWNRSLPSSDEMFLAGDLAFYFGFASERNSLVQRNPNLNFGISQLPQSRSDENNRITGGQMHFFGILNQSSKISASFTTIMHLIDSQYMIYLYDLYNLPPVRRDLLQNIPSVDYQDIFNKSALISNLFIDPDPNQTDSIYQDAIESVISGRSSTLQALTKVDQDLDLLLNN